MGGPFGLPCFLAAALDSISACSTAALPLVANQYAVPPAHSAAITADTRISSMLELLDTAGADASLASAVVGSAIQSFLGFNCRGFSKARATRRRRSASDSATRKIRENRSVKCNTRASVRQKVGARSVTQHTWPCERCARASRALLVELVHIRERVQQVVAQGELRSGAFEHRLPGERARPQDATLERRCRCELQREVRAPPA